MKRRRVRTKKKYYIKCQEQLDEIMKRHIKEVKMMSGGAFPLWKFLFDVSA